MRVEWDKNKNASNQRKHGVSFEEASELFTSGSDYLEIFDSQHSIHEDRFICVGFIQRGVVLVVMTESVEDCIRIISARWATPREEGLLAAYLGGGTAND